MRLLKKVSFLEYFRYVCISQRTTPWGKLRGRGLAESSTAKDAS